MQKPLKIAIVGPESTGKSTLASQLADHYQTVWVPEFARSYLDELGRPYQKDDLTSIAKGQLEAEKAYLKQANRFLFCDTNLLVIKIWSEFKYGACDPWILENMGLDQYAVHFLTDIDIPWKDDPQREHPHKRKELWDIYSAELTRAGVNMVEIRGDWKERLRMAVDAIEKFFE